MGRTGRLVGGDLTRGFIPAFFLFLFLDFIPAFFLFLLLVGFRLAFFFRSRSFPSPLFWLVTRRPRLPSPPREPSELSAEKAAARKLKNSKRKIFIATTCKVQFYALKIAIAPIFRIMARTERRLLPQHTAKRGILQ